MFLLLVELKIWEERIDIERDKNIFFFFPAVEIVKCGNKHEGSSKRQDVGKEKGRKKENGVRKHNHEQGWWKQSKK